MVKPPKIDWRYNVRSRSSGVSIVEAKGKNPRLIATFTDHGGDGPEPLARQLSVAPEALELLEELGNLLVEPTLQPHLREFLRTPDCAWSHESIHALLFRVMRIRMRVRALDDV